MNNYISLGGYNLVPSVVQHSPERVSKVNEYSSGRKQEYFKRTRHNFHLEFAAIDETTRLLLETLSISTAVIYFTDEFGRTYGVRPASFQAQLTENALPSSPKFDVTIDLEEL